VAFAVHAGASGAGDAGVFALSTSAGVDIARELVAMDGSVVPCWSGRGGVEALLSVSGVPAGAGVAAGASSSFPCDVPAASSL
jgi:hypothetical protein